MYDIIKDATYEKNKTNDFINIKNNFDESFADALEMSNFCNEYFINIGDEMAKAIPPPQIECQVDPPIPNTIFLNPIIKNELIKHIAYLLKNNSSPDYDGVRVSIVKQTHLEIVDPLVHVFNLSYFKLVRKDSIF